MAVDPREQLDGRAPGACGEEPQAIQSGGGSSILPSRFTDAGRGSGVTPRNVRVYG